MQPPSRSPYLISIPAGHGIPALAPVRVGEYLNRAGRCYTLGTRGFFLCVPIVFWFFGPHFMLAATAGLLLCLDRLDRAPRSARS